jgi:hypothetical protein
MTILKSITSNEIQTAWFKWSERNSIQLKKEPAVYFIAYSTKNINQHPFSYIESIIYIGVTTSKDGLKSRLDQFDKGLRGKNGVHGGAERVRVKHPNPDLFFENVFLSACIFPLSTSRETANDWRIKAACLAKEYNSFADYMDLFGCLPEFNDPKRSPKGKNE